MRRNLGVATLLAVVVIAVAGWWFLLRDDAPPPPDLVSATQVAAAAQSKTVEPAPTTVAPTTTTVAPTTTTVAPTTTTVAPTTTTVAPTTTAALCWSCAYEEASTTTVASTTTAALCWSCAYEEASTTTLVPEETDNVDSKDVSGTWSVDTTIGEFGIDEASGTFVGFRVKEVLGQGIGSATAVGRTPLVSGSAEIDGTTLVGAEIVADLTGLRTDRPMRDSRVQDALNTGAHPEATFVLSGPVDLGEGRQVQVPAPGSLTINGVTNTVTVDLAAELVGRILAVVGTIDVVFADYDVEAPTAPVVVSVEDHGIVEVQLFLTR